MTLSERNHPSGLATMLRHECCDDLVSVEFALATAEQRAEFERYWGRRFLSAGAADANKKFDVLGELQTAHRWAIAANTRLAKATEALRELRDFGTELQASGPTEETIIGIKVENIAQSALPRGEG